ncbi:MAG TPA: peptidoglycan-associated lipoprotein Pal [Burkholderiaceae bacterium]|jgi:peptidoglycan-associated lipoprotein|nr:peptidoglycan-associated lipoprotein Pal [Burkholderiaceae bacterium]
MKPTIRLALVATMVAFLAACGSSVKLEDEASMRGTGAPIESRDGAGGATAGGAGARGVEQVTVGGTDPLNDPKSPLAKRSIFFDFDSFVIKDEFRGTVDAHSRYLLSNKTRRVVIQGNTDERGSREYNLALGQKRAEAVRRAMSALGVPDTQMEAVSFGEERPRATGADEASYAENRRADLVYQ